MDKKDIETRGNKGLFVPFIRQSTVTECGEEFTLPDYYPEIKRVVSTLCRVLPEGWYDSADTVEQGGVVAFTVLYLGDDGSLTAAPLTCDFKASVPMPQGADHTSAVISAETTVENVSCRATGPRRLTLRARLRMAVTGDKVTDTDTAIVSTAGDEATMAEKLSVQTKNAEIFSMRRACGRVTGTVSGELRERAGVKPIMCDGDIMVTEAVSAGDTVTLRGDAVMWCICYGDDGLYFKTSAKVPFEEKISHDGETADGSSARGHGRCAAVSVKEREDGTLAWDMEYDLECETGVSITTDVAEDMYSTDYDSRVTAGKCESESLLRCGIGRLSLSGSGTRNGTPTQGDYVIGSFGKAVCDRLERKGGRLILTGTAEVRVIICGGGDAVEECVRIPYKYECDCADSGDGELFWRCDASVCDSTARIEGNTVHVTAELSISLMAGLTCPVEYAEKLELDRGTKHDDGDGIFRIYYPSEGETAWDITKKYRIKKNAVTEVTGGGVLIE